MEEKIREKLYLFFKNNEINQDTFKIPLIFNPPNNFKWENWTQLLYGIKNDIQITAWAITQIPYWTRINDTQQYHFIVDKLKNGQYVYLIDDYYFTIKWNTWEITSLKPIIITKEFVEYINI